MSKKISFERRHFEFIAATIKELSPELRAKTAFHFADKLRFTNPKFIPGRFIVACGVDI